MLQKFVVSINMSGRKDLVRASDDDFTSIIELININMKTATDVVIGFTKS